MRHELPIAGIRHIAEIADSPAQEDLEEFSWPGVPSYAVDHALLHFNVPGLGGSGVAVQKSLKVSDRLAVVFLVDFSRDVPEMRSKDDVVQLPQRALLYQRLLVIDVDRSSAGFACSQRCDKISFHDQWP